MEGANMTADGFIVKRRRSRVSRSETTTEEVCLFALAYSGI
jgi:hypothetical protein